MKKVNFSGIGLSILLILSACNSENVESGIDTIEEFEKDTEINTENELKELEDLLIANEYDKFLVRINSIDDSNLDESEIGKFNVLGNEFVDKLITEKNIDYINSNLNDISSTKLISDNTEKLMYNFRNEQRDFFQDEMERNIRDNERGKAIKIFEENEFIHKSNDAIALYNFALYLISYNKDTIEQKEKLASVISPSYTGRMSGEIQEELIASLTEEAWRTVYSESNSIAKSSSSPSIGMTDEEVLETSWGKPKSINKTQTAYGVNEQWVYDRGYLYFENHYLVTIQSSR
ncbi:hypothetical protein MKX53_18915 [Psychrobacillus sp. FSL K6-4615]|uniref:hypothetical protein n=1 Tax=Psychrobacillus sp. FSL K6-4615 TaxID=2921551 RepID=UPI0030FA0EE6